MTLGNEQVDDFAEFEKDFNRLIVSDDNVTEEEAPANVAEDNTEVTPEETRADNETEQASLVAPANWSKEMKEAFAELPTNRAKEVMLEQYKNMQADYTKKTTEVAEDKKYNKQIKDIFEPHREHLKMLGIPNEVEAIKRLVELDIFARKDPAGYVKYVSKGLGVDLESLIFDDEPKQTPETSQISQELALLKQKLNLFEQEKHQQSYSQFEQEINSFKNATDANGNLKYPLFDDFSIQIGHILEKDPKSTLESAYNKATENVSKYFSEKQVVQLDEQRKKAEINKARVAGRGVSTPSYTLANGKPAETLDDIINVGLRSTGFKK
jgi:hypothetical protein